MKYTYEILNEAVKESFSFAGVLRSLGLKQAGGTQSYIAQRIRSFGIDTTHFTGQAHGKGTRSPKRKSPDEILIRLPSGSMRAKLPQLRRALSEKGITSCCSECGLQDQWNNKPIQLHIDHHDGDWLNCSLENLRYLCPNCHSQTDTYCKIKGR